MPFCQPTPPITSFSTVIISGTKGRQPSIATKITYSQPSRAARCWSNSSISRRPSSDHSQPVLTLLTDQRPKTVTHSKYKHNPKYCLYVKRNRLYHLAIEYCTHIKTLEGGERTLGNRSTHGLLPYILTPHSGL